MRTETLGKFLMIWGVVGMLAALALGVVGCARSGADSGPDIRTSYVGNALCYTLYVAGEPRSVSCTN